MAKQGNVRRRRKSVPPRKRHAHSYSGMAELKDAGVSGFVEKGISVNDFLGTIRSVARGRKVVLLTGAPDAGEQRGRASREADESVFGGIRLTSREREIFALFAASLSKAQISRRLHISLATLDRHVQRILRQIDASGRNGR